MTDPTSDTAEALLLPSINHDGRPWWPWMLVLETKGKIDKIVANKAMNVADLARLVAALPAEALTVVMRATSKQTIDEATDLESERVLAMTDEEVLGEFEHPERAERWGKATGRWIQQVVSFKQKADEATTRASTAERELAEARAELATPPAVESPDAHLRSHPAPETTEAKGEGDGQHIGHRAFVERGSPLKRWEQITHEEQRAWLQGAMFGHSEAWEKATRSSSAKDERIVEAAKQWRQRIAECGDEEEQALADAVDALGGGT